MKNAKIVLVAQWDGWCGACAADRPLVLTRTGRQRLRTWLTGASDDSRPLLLTCRLCGTGVDVPLEQDDPPVVLDTAEPEPAAVDPAAVADVPEHVVAAAELPAVPAPVSATDLTAARQAVAEALGALLARRAAVPAVPLVTASPAPAVPVPTAAATPAVAPALPLQRTASSDGLAELQLLADGIDLLSSGRS